MNAGYDSEEDNVIAPDIQPLNFNSDSIPNTRQ